MGVLQDREAAKLWYEGVSAFYEPFVSDTFWPERLQRRVVGMLDGDGIDHVLDVGCGTGLTSEHLAERAGQVEAIDHSTPQLVEATKRGLPGVRFLRADAECIPFEDGTFDAVVSVGAIIYFPHPVAALEEAHRVTRPGGEILIAGFNRPTLPSVNPVENWTALANETFFLTYDREEARQLFSDAGWTKIRSYVTGPAWHPRLVLLTRAKKATEAQASATSSSG
jgi:ubiquinone/menaquinone biosynthesis C-methylase UbiE